jgi:hypothetical protein
MDPTRSLASANFEEQDAGSGPIHASPSLGPMTAALHNIQSRHLHDLTVAAAPDDRQFLRAWRQQLQECLTQHNARLVRFLVADGSGGDLAEAALTKRCLDVLTKYSKPTWSFTSSTRDLALPVAPPAEAATAELESELGIAPGTLHSTLRRAVRLYVATAAELSAAEGRLEEKLRMLETVVGRIHDLMFMEPTEALGGLEGPARAYLDSVLSKLSFEEDYREIVRQAARFSVLKGIVGLGTFQRSAAPTCSICMTREVSRALAPCGHMFCESCITDKTTACYICRVQVRDRLRLYFS